MKLNYRELGSGRPLVILHGLFGSLDNWVSLAKVFAKSHHVHLVDQRNHGRSPHTDSHSYDEMAADLFEFFQEHDLKDAVLMGHSMGGKTAMRFSGDHADLLRKLIVVDMGIKQYPVHHELLIRSMQAMDLQMLTSRNEAAEFLMHLLEEERIVQFLTKNLYRLKQEDGTQRFIWRFNLDVLAADILEMGLPITDGADVPVLFLNGTRSPYVQESDRPEMLRLFPRAQFSSLPTGHWVHAEDPRGFVETVSSFIAE